MDLSQNYFDLFGLPQRFDVDKKQLLQGYRKLQREFHPDSYANKNHSEQRLAEQFSAYINTAYQTLASTVLRAKYLLSLSGFEVDKDKMTIADTQFLLKQMQWREQLADIAQSDTSVASVDSLSALVDEVTSQEQVLIVSFTQWYQRNDFSQAMECVAKLHFVDKIQCEIERLEDALLD